MEIAGADIARVLVAAACTYAAILAFTRLAGLRSFSKMSASDFAMTIAVGSVFASTITSSSSSSLAIGLTALASLFAGQWLIAWLRSRTSWAGKLVDNRPLLLMAQGTVFDDQLRRANMTRDDLFAKLRESNALTLDSVRAVVFETTGDVSVLHAADEDARLDPELLRDVEGAERFSRSP